MPATAPHPPVWTVADAKARLSEVLRLAKETPQYIGTKNSCVVIPQETWEALNQPKEPFGKWLVENLAQGGELELPDRQDTEREIPFQ